MLFSVFRAIAFLVNTIIVGVSIPAALLFKGIDAAVSVSFGCILAIVFYSIVKFYAKPKSFIAKKLWIVEGAFLLAGSLLLSFWPLSKKHQSYYLSLLSNSEPAIVFFEASQIIRFCDFIESRLHCIVYDSKTTCTKGIYKVARFVFIAVALFGTIVFTFQNFSEVLNDDGNTICLRSILGFKESTNKVKIMKARILIFALITSVFIFYKRRNKLLSTSLIVLYTTFSLSFHISYPLQISVQQSKECTFFMESLLLRWINKICRLFLHKELFTRAVVSCPLLPREPTLLEIFSFLWNPSYRMRAWKILVSLFSCIIFPVSLIGDLNEKKNIEKAKKAFLQNQIEPVVKNHPLIEETYAKIAVHMRSTHWLQFGSIIASIVFTRLILGSPELIAFQGSLGAVNNNIKQSDTVLIDDDGLGTALYQLIIVLVVFPLFHKSSDEKVQALIDAKQHSKTELIGKQK